MTPLDYPAAATASSPPAMPLAGNTEAPDMPPRRMSAGPGWYESSWDLLRGLDVREAPLEADHAAPDHR